MPINAWSGLSGSDFASLSRASAVNQVRAAAPSPAATAKDTSTDPSESSLPPKPEQPVLLVPIIPLSPAVLAELVGYHLSLTWPGASQ
jgi:hypothetical protein